MKSRDSFFPCKYTRYPVLISTLFFRSLVALQYISLIILAGHCLQFLYRRSKWFDTAFELLLGFGRQVQLNVEFRHAILRRGLLIVHALSFSVDALVLTPSCNKYPAPPLLSAPYSPSLSRLLHSILTGIDHFH